MNYINTQDLAIDEAKVGFDLNDDGDLEDSIVLTIEYDPEDYPETNGYHVTYLDLYKAEFRENLQWYLDNLDYAEDWTWFDAEGHALSDEAVAVMSSADKAQAFIEGRYAKSSSRGMDILMMSSMFESLMNGEMPAEFGNMSDFPAMDGNMGDFLAGGMPESVNDVGMDDMEAMFGESIRNGGPAMGSTASANGGRDSSDYADYLPE